MQDDSESHKSDDARSDDAVTGGESWPEAAVPWPVEVKPVDSASDGAEDPVPADADVFDAPISRIDWSGAEHPEHAERVAAEIARRIADAETTTGAVRARDEVTLGEIAGWIRQRTAETLDIDPEDVTMKNTERLFDDNG